LIGEVPVIPGCLGRFAVNNGEGYMKNGAMTGSISQRETLVRLSLGAASSHATCVNTYFIKKHKKECDEVCAFSLTDHIRPEYYATGSFSTLQDLDHLYLLLFPCTCRQLTEILFQKEFKAG
jgi:hypothetical protein